MHRRVAALAFLAIACTSYACQAFISAGSYFNAQGVTYLVQYSDLDPPPNQLTLTPNGLFFVESNSIWVVATAGSTPPALVKTFSGPPTSLEFDGVDTIFSCDPSGSVFAASASTLEAVSAPSVPAACLGVSASANTLATLAVGDAGAAGEDPDAAVPLTLTITDRVRGTEKQLPQRSLTTFDLTLASQGDDTYVTALGELHRYVPPERGAVANCVLAFVGQTPRPKILPLPSGSGGPALLLRGRSDIVHVVDPDAGCCDTEECATKRVATSVQPGVGDFTLAAPYVYWSDQNTVKRQLLSNIDSGADPEIVVSIGDSTSLITQLAADDQAVYLVIGSELLRAPLPAGLGQ